MHLTADLCRNQQAIHRERALSSTLENVRNVANKAAIAWGIEADAADDREARRSLTRQTVDLTDAQKQAGTAALCYPDDDSDLVDIAVRPSQ